ncbi:DUF3999 family protein [Pedobacter sp. HDW13]|uniref:DUF3999 family protein n=1 Tax=Pedobacter sp. HDW13 TaxID=2714940 RepID=UPI0014098811|nr:DUF3999 family protein [Pedobacter sp. HDW13]QIL40932.1 DUF3999 family protein [Pedobacter sp. HDW13]
MMWRLKTKLLFWLLPCVLAANAQTAPYRLKREITGVQATWHSMVLPNPIYQKLKPGFEDLRIFGIKGKDTVEIPYLLKQRDNQINTKEIAFKQLNQSSANNTYYYTFRPAVSGVINQINLDFKQENFDWKVTLEGSNDNQNWFTIVKDYRILSIKNQFTDYHFTRINFPDAKYAYFRIAIKNSAQMELLTTKILKTDTIKGIFQDIKYQSYNIKNDAEHKETVIDINLTDPVPVSQLSLNAQSDFDFYRPFKIDYATDSFKTDKGIKYNYMDLYTGTVSSIEKPVFSFPNTITSKLRITIQNNDNKPLRLSGLALKGCVYELIARFDDPKLRYALYYGNNKAVVPSYEIEKFENKIPANLSSLTIGEEQQNPAYTAKVTKPLFENKAWLWVLMAVIIVLLGWFSFKMLRN